MVVLVNRAKMSTSTTGTGTLTLGSAVAGYQTFADAGVSDGDVVRYVIEDGDNWEIGTGTYTASGTTLSRTVVDSNNSDNAINLSGDAEVFVSATAADIGVLPSTTASTSSTSQTAIATYSASSYSSAKLMISVTKGTDRQVSELLVVHDGTTASATEYAQVYTNASLATFNVDINSGNVRVLATASSATTTNYTVKEILVDA